MRLTRFVHAVRTSLGVVPLLCVLAGVLIVLGTLWLDRRSGYTLVPQSVTGTPSDAQTTLSIFATAMASLTSLVLTLTLVVVQLAMGQFSPRIVAALLSDRFSQLAIGLFGATFVVALGSSRSARVVVIVTACSRVDLRPVLSRAVVSRVACWARIPLNGRSIAMTSARDAGHAERTMERMTSSHRVVHAATHVRYFVCGIDDCEDRTTVGAAMV